MIFPRILPVVLLCAATTVRAQDVPGPTPLSGNIVHSSLPQPAAPPDHPELDQPELPPLAPVLARAENNPLIYGLYVWTGEYSTPHDSIRQVGWKTLRLGGPLDDAVMTRLVRDDGVEILRCVGAKPKSDADPAGDDALLHEQAGNITKFFDRYGPGGTFFKEHPELPDRPIRAMEVWNEPNFQYLIKPDKRPGPEQEADREKLYAKVLANAYETVRAHHPQVKVVGFSTGGSSAGDLRFVKHVLDLDPKVAADFEVFATHPYVDPAPPECYQHRSWGKYSIASSLATLRGTLADHGRAEVPVWYTEVGWQVAGADGGRYPLAREKSVTPELQAAYTCRLYAYALRLGVERVTNMFAVDTDGYNGGFFLPDGKWRPSASAVQTMIRLLPAPKLLEAVSDGKDGLFAYRFATGSGLTGPVTMYWNISGPKVVEIAVNAPKVTIADMLGHEQTVAVSNGKVFVEIGPLPVYIQVAGP